MSIVFYQPDVAARLDAYQIKAAFIYRFLLFTEFPKNRNNRDDQNLTVCIYGRDFFKDSFNPVIGRVVKNRTLSVKRVDSSYSLESLSRCQVLFLGSNNSKNEIVKVLEGLKNSSVLSIGERDDFLYIGGIIRLYEERGKTQFDINKTEANSAKIRFRSQMLRIANKIIDE